MGIYVNPGNRAFVEAVNSMIYVDKSRLISYTNKVLNTNQKYMCVSRPRRFGKSMAADMLVAYYSKGCNSEELFSGLAIGAGKSERVHLNQHDVIRLDVHLLLFTPFTVTDAQKRQKQPFRAQPSRVCHAKKCVKTPRGGTE